MHMCPPWIYQAGAPSADAQVKVAAHAWLHAAHLREKAMRVGTGNLHDRCPKLSLC